MTPMADPTYDLLIRGGTLIDGTRAPRTDADVAVLGGRIAAVGELSAARAQEVIDASGRIVAPGFIDVHTHDDSALMSQPAMGFKVSQGVTTVVTGNCGISIAPLPADRALPAPLNLIDGPEGPHRRSIGAWFERLRAAPAAVNVAALVGHSSLRVCTMDRVDRPATEGEIAAMRVLLDQALADGAVGLSTGTFYPPAAHATEAEIIAVGEPMRGRGAVYATHMRDEGDRVLQAIDETLRIGRALDTRVVVSHHKVTGPANAGRSRETLAHLRDAMRCQCVSLDCYPYTAGSTMIHRERVAAGVKVLIASSVPHPECAGRNIDDIAAEWGVSREVAADRLQPGSAIYFMMDEADVRAIMAFDETMIGSDGIPVGSHPHPRLWGTFPRVLGLYSRELGLFPLETAVWKMTGLPARNFGLADRGTVAPGQAADLVIFDAATVRDRATYEDPQQPAAGIEQVIVNGVPTWRGGAHLGARAGQVLVRGARAER